MRKIVNVTRDLESRARIASEAPMRGQERAASPAGKTGKTEECLKSEKDAPSAEEVRPEAEQSSLAAAKPKKGGRTSQRNSQAI